MTQRTKTRVCTTCSEEKTVEAFYKDPRRRSGLRASCIACTRSSQREYFWDNRERLLEYYTENRDKWIARYAKDREAVLAQRAAYARTPDGLASRRAARQRRRARELAADCGCVTAATMRAVWTADQSLCVYCGAPGEHIDHVTPLSRGGLNCVENLHVACARCNTTKAAQTAIEFAGVDLAPSVRCARSISQDRVA